jgi:hypothetical protein
MFKHRFKKFERSKNPPGFRIVQTDLKILKLLAECRFLDARQIAAAFPTQTERNIRRRLHFLFHNGYVERPDQQRVAFKPSDFLVYSLAKKGAGLVSKSVDLAAEAKRSKEVGVSFLRHSLMMSDFRLALGEALKNNRQFKLSIWKELGAIDAVICEGDRLPIAPDAFFTIEANDCYRHFFLEADRSTMTLERMLNKFKGYWNWRAEEGHKQKLGIFSFRVLTICPSDERAENLRRVAAEASGGNASDLFWFASEKSYNLKNPENILTPIWRSAKGRGFRQLLE